ncbi:hypothetical protein PUN28_000899 [Cardiocondyla obscurior]|uniref:C2H2-type domain-containing protein n=2 Tax=Cardiocondyla obscurior TaxID=286306 RepID=A0AAW2H278_9HYME
MFNFQRTDRVCRFCKETFCCSRCCNRHVDKDHSDVNTDCPLCASEVLSIRQGNFARLNFEDEKLLCHVINKHLPLHCKLCGVLFESKEDFKSIAACKWFKLWHGLTSTFIYDHQEKKLKPHSISDSDCNWSRFCTPPEIYRKTSTPMFDSQKNSFETPCVPKFTLKTPQTNSPSITQVTSSISKTNNTRYFSFLLTSNDKITPFKTCRDEQLPRNNSGRNLIVTYEKENEIDDDAVQVSPPVNVNLTTFTGGILQNSPQSDIFEDVVKVRFSDEFKTATEASEFSGNLMEPCVQNNFYASEEEEEEEFHDARNEITQKAKTATENIKDRKNIITKNNKDVNDIKNMKSTNDSQEKDKRRSLTEPSEYFVSPQSAAKERDSKRLLMMVLVETVESNSGELSNDLMPLINSGLKKLQEQLISANRQSPPSDSKSGEVCRRSITTMNMHIASIESYSPKSAAAVTNHEQFASSSSSSSSSVRSESSNNSGFLSTVTDALKQAFKSVSGLSMPSTSIQATKVMRREVIEELTSSQGSSSIDSARPGKRNREVFEGSSKESPFALTLDAKSPLAKRQKGWYKMIKGRQPISRMRNNRVTTSPRGVSTERQVFRQGSLTVGDTILPLPTRAHQSTD